MLKFLFIIFFFGFILVSLLGFSVFRTFKSFFSGDPKDRNRRRTTVNSNQQRNRPQNTTTQNNPPPKKKVFADDEGEYVDYEEVKD